LFWCSTQHGVLHRHSAYVCLSSPGGTHRSVAPCSYSGAVHNTGCCTVTLPTSVFPHPVVHTVVWLPAAILCGSLQLFWCSTQHGVLHRHSAYVCLSSPGGTHRSVAPCSYSGAVHNTGCCTVTLPTSVFPHPVVHTVVWLPAAILCGSLQLFWCSTQHGVLHRHSAYVCLSSPGGTHRSVAPCSYSGAVHNTGCCTVTLPTSVFPHPVVHTVVWLLQLFWCSTQHGVLHRHSAYVCLSSPGGTHRSVAPCSYSGAVHNTGCCTVTLPTSVFPHPVVHRSVAPCFGAPSAGGVIKEQRLVHKRGRPIYHTAACIDVGNDTRVASYSVAIPSLKTRPSIIFKWPPRLAVLAMR
ncbi:hypothetical protein J6590_035398, partial [Homalodisca vitripennis]